MDKDDLIVGYLKDIANKCDLNANAIHKLESSFNKSLNQILVDVNNKIEKESEKVKEYTDNRIDSEYNELRTKHVDLVLIVNTYNKQTDARIVATEHGYTDISYKLGELGVKIVAIQKKNDKWLRIGIIIIALCTGLGMAFGFFFKYVYTYVTVL